MIHYIYIPGFGDRFNPLRRWALRRWKRDDTRVTLVPMKWSDKNETYQQKYARVEKAIISTNPAEKIHIVGESAGGAMALYAFSQHSKRINRVTTICGYNHDADVIAAFQRKRHPAFYSLVQKVDPAIENFSVELRQHITTIVARRDRVVNAKYSRIDDAHEITLPTSGHFVTIAYVLIKTLTRWHR